MDALVAEVIEGQVAKQNAKQVSDAKGNASNQAVSPDSKYIAYQSTLDGGSDIYVYDVTVGTTRRVTDSSFHGYAPTWQCGSSKLVFTSDVTGDSNIFLADALPVTAAPISVSSATQLTNDKSADQFPQNSPAVEDASYRSSIGNQSGR